ncbi:N,N-dimethylformamidase large subunit [Roseomonas sp. PWR1]|uniref:N,N-dimethylformamidase large subunit n=1 Tax=Roseomonas nitratireducens TaxID=2820810 RepID=A0ABS4ANX6_9PROT|nr:N,N-dimethylformamidase beta subunit family domain-containing protein [Neoroseomonas nitratireducens]MBP0463066.1 N,N-dimethylformamidase large subunit [Neoroseomonas nitratireducens]
MSDKVLPITGYLDRFSHRPGERFEARVSLREPGPARARLVRVISGDPNPEGPGLRFEDLSQRFDHVFEGRSQPIRRGSHALIARPPRRGAGPCTWTALLRVVAPPRAPAALISEEQPGLAVTILVGAEGASAEIAFGGEVHRIATGARWPLRRWMRVWLSADPASGRIVLGQQAIDGTRPTVATATVPGLVLPDGGGRLLVAARDAAAPRDHVTGKVEDPAILAGFQEAWPQPDAQLSPATPGLLAGWDFSRDIPTQRVLDIGPQSCDGVLVNVPTRAMVGARWSGAEMCWRHAPRDYGAIQFNADDLGDCGWGTDFTFTVPQDLRSGAYAFHITCAGGEDWLPFYVLPPRGTSTAPVAFLASTFTYQAYANHARGNADAAYKARVAAWGAYPHNPDDYPIYGRSTYNRHPDNSGIAFSSRLRPILTMRPGFLTFNDQRGSGLRHYPADTHILAWLEARGIAFDVITDEDVHEEGEALLANYRVVMTGSHPEYHTRATLDALASYTRERGRMMYLGGNGFYWRIAVTQTLPGILELRRAEGGIRAWAAEPGEYYHQTDGAYGGLWRRNGRPPQMLAGVGFSGQGLFEGTHYRLLPAARDPRHAWIFEGVEGETFGGYGLSGGGAAGFELDRADVALGTPEDTAILARSEDPPASFVTVPEELLSHVNTVTGEKADALKRAEIVIFETPGGGAVFATGSITWCGSLWQAGAFQGPVSRIMENVLRRFAGA